MDAREKYIEQIDRFLCGELSETEEREYRLRLKNDKAFKKLHDEQVMVKKGITYAQRSELKKHLSYVEAQISEKDNTATASAWSYSRIAAGLLLLIGIISAIYIFSTGPHSPGLYDRYFSPPATFAPLPVRGPATPNDAIRAYNMGDFEEADRLFRASIDRQADYRVLYYRGITNMRLKNYGIAIDLLQQVLAKNNDLQPDARWHLALSYLVQGQNQQVIPLLQELATSDSQYQSNAVQLLEELRTGR